MARGERAPTVARPGAPPAVSCWREFQGCNSAGRSATEGGQEGVWAQNCRVLTRFRAQTIMHSDGGGEGTALVMFDRPCAPRRGRP